MAIAGRHDTDIALSFAQAYNEWIFMIVLCEKCLTKSDLILVKIWKIFTMQKILNISEMPHMVGLCTLQVISSRFYVSINTHNKYNPSSRQVHWYNVSIMFV